MTQVWQRHLHRRDKDLTLLQVHAGRAPVAVCGGTATVPEDRLHIVTRTRVTQDDRAFNTRQRMFGQKLQNADVLPSPGRGAVPAFKVGTQFAEHGRQLPVAVNVGVVQGGRLAL